MKILVVAAGSGETGPAHWACTSSAGFLVHVVVQDVGDGYAIGVESTGFAMGLAVPTCVVGGIANDTVTINFGPNMNSFLTLQTDDFAKASIGLV
jgi:hypothetical protein